MKRGEYISDETVVKRAKEEDRDSVILYSTNHNFWNNSGFFKIPEQAKKHKVDVMQLKSEDFDNYIKFVENKTNLNKHKEKQLLYVKDGLCFSSTFIVGFISQN